MRAVFSIVVITIFGIWSLICILTAFIGSLITISKKPTVFLAKYMWAPIAIKLFGSHLKIEGLDKVNMTTPYVVMANHCSYLDIAALFRTMPFYLHFIAKKELKRMPFLGWFMILSDMIFIDRKNTASAKESLAKAANLVAHGRNVVIFPEGTASKTGKINEFKKGGFHLAADANAFIVPVKIEGTYVVWPSAKKLAVKPGKIVVKIGEPISPDVYKNLELENRIKYVKEIIENL